jgi:hypothetical protein
VPAEGPAAAAYHLAVNCRMRFVAGWMHRKAEGEAASRANGDDENAARRRPGAEICGEFVVRDTSQVPIPAAT